MNNIWDIVLRAAESQPPIKKSELFFRQADAVSPWYEQSFDFINQSAVDKKEIEINALCRFSAICQEIIHPDFRSEPVQAELAVYLFDVLMHWLSELDLRHGLTKREYYVRRLRQELCEGVFGAKAALIMQTLRPSRQLVLAGELYKVFQTGAGLMSFCRVMRRLFYGCHIYQGRQQPLKLYIYLNRERSEDDKCCIEFLCDTFLPEEFKCRIFWKYHFGIIDVPETMAINKIAIF